VGVDESESFEAGGRRTEAIKGRDDDVFVAAYDYVGDFPLPADENAYLTVDLPGEGGQGSGEIMGDDALRMDLPPVKLRDSLDLFRPETGQVTIDSLDMCVSFSENP
jgi:hypothetical protein